MHRLPRLDALARRCDDGWWMPRRPYPRTFHGVRVDAAPSSLDELCAAYLQRAGADEFFSHLTAAKLWGLPLPARFAGRRTLDVSVVAPAHPPQTAGVVGHRLTRSDQATLRGFPIADAAHVWVQLAEPLSLDELVIVGDHLIRRKSPLSSAASLADVVVAGSGRRGIRNLRLAVALVRPGTDSPAETRMRLILVRAGLPEAVVGHQVFDGAHYVGTPDLAFPQERVCIEYEGDGHRTDRATFRYDIERHERFRDADWHPIRATADHLRTPAAFAARVERALARRSSRGE